MAPRVALFATCLGDQFFAEAVADAVRLLRALGIEVEFPPDQTCCGQPAFNAGHHDHARAMAEHTERVFAASSTVVLPSGSCTAMLRRHYPDLGADGGTDDATDDGTGAGSAPLARRARELSEFVVRDLGVTELGRGLAGMRVAYHHGCHALRDLGLGEEAELLLTNAGAELVPWEAARECCGFGGLFAAKLPHVSAAMADRKLDTLPAADVVTSADGGCLLHLAGRLNHRVAAGPGRARPPRVRHLASLLWEARRG